MPLSRIAAAAAMFLALSSCRESDVVVSLPPPASTSGAYVVNEGGFSGGGSLSYYDKARDTLFNDVIGSAAGWVFPNDMKLIGGKGYVAVNGADRVDVLTVDSNRIAASIQVPQFTGPGYFAYGGGVLFTANYNGTVSALSIAGDSVRAGSAAVVAFPGGIAYVGGKLFVSDFGAYGQPVPSHRVVVLNPATLHVTDSVRVGDLPGAMTLLGGKLFVVCAGSSNATPHLYEIDPDSDRAVDSVGLAGSVSDIATDGRDLFVLESSGVGKFSAGPLRTVRNPFITRGGGNFFYALAADSTTGDIYVTNIVATGGSGQLEIYSAAGTRKRPPLPAGIFPGAIAFK